MDKDYAKKMAVRMDKSSSSAATDAATTSKSIPPGPPDVGEDSWLPS